MRMQAGVVCVLPARQTCEQMVFILERLRVRSQLVVLIPLFIEHARLMVISFMHGDAYYGIIIIIVYKRE
ncbi:hypothetical protein PAHAL_3G510000 [Panicum hallii]|jgi:hypothetical protein|uniref:Uncharacterized protein n=1 Tax=Panicum hallii TaxID=206008 RepID=A0A2T8KM85_9POAL|nr:hypothetical protein PAHAL_3G510000 [Panicum hallii]